MSKRTVRFRSRAAADVDAAVDHYRREAGESVAVDFVEALEHCVRRSRNGPHVGSLLFSYELGIPELRTTTTQRFPYVVFYLPGDDHIDVWRVLHSRRDIPTTLADDD